MDHHLAGEETGNTRNGYGRKTVTTETGRIDLENVPCFRRAPAGQRAGLAMAAQADPAAPPLRLFRNEPHRVPRAPRAAWPVRFKLYLNRTA